MIVQNALKTASFRLSPVVPVQHWAVDPSSPSGLMESIGGRMLYGREVEIYGENEPTEYFYKVISGAVRTYKVLADGRRQICAFHLSGDCFGLEPGKTHTLSAETIVDSRLLVINRGTFLRRAESDKRIARCLWAMTAAELQAAQAHLLLLIRTAKERVAAFLMEIADRSPDAGQLDLPMSRQDIADYLGLTIETVSRTLTDLENSAAIWLQSSRRVVLRDREALRRYCS